MSAAESVATVRLATPRREPYGLIGVMATAAMLFITFTASYLIRSTGTDWGPLELPRILWVNTAVLALSSVTLEWARRRGGARWLAITVLLGLAFLVGQIGAWRSLAAAGMFLASHPQSSFFYMLTAVHGLHLIGGLVALGLAARSGRHRGAAAAWWHFMGLIWLYLLILLALF